MKRKIAASCAMAITSVMSAGADSPTERTYKLQVGLNIIATYDQEHPFLNKAKALSGTWRFNSATGRIQGQEALDKGLIDPITSMPQNLPAKLDHVSGGVFFREAGWQPAFVEGEYLLRWSGVGRGTMVVWERHNEDYRTRNSVDYKIARRGGKLSPMGFTKIGDGFGNIEFFNKKYAPLIDRGEIWDPTFIAYAKRHDIIRTMNYQSGGAWPQRSFEDVATMDEFWGQKFSLQWPQAEFFGTPYEALFNLGVKTGRELWVHAPLQIGSPTKQGHPSLRRSDNNNRTNFDALQDVTRQNTPEIIASDKWEEFADAFAERLVASRYPLDRILYVEVGNEVWNYSHGHKYGTIYATGIAKSYNPDWNKRHGYGILTARWMAALNTAFEKLGVAPNIVYVIAAQTGSARSIQDAFDGMRFYFKSNDLDPNDFTSQTGVAVTGYYGFAQPIRKTLLPGVTQTNIRQKWEEAIERDAEGLEDKIVDIIANGPASTVGTKAWLLKSWTLQKTIAEQNGSQFIGAYEGGSHFVPHHTLKKSDIFKNWWRDFHWGEKGADLGRQVNLALIDQFPTAILSNYGSMGDTDFNPWFDGHYGNWTPMLQMWDEFAIPGHTGSPIAAETNKKSKAEK